VGDRDWEGDQASNIGLIASDLTNGMGVFFWWRWDQNAPLVRVHFDWTAHGGRGGDGFNP